MRKEHSISRRTALAGLTALAAQPAASLAQGAYPTRPVRIIVPFSAGSATDTAARYVANELSNRLKQQFVVENKPGASGIIGLDLAAKAPPDGYTLVHSGPGLATFHVLFKKTPFDPVKDFTPVAIIYESIGGVLVNGSVPASNMREFAAWARANPGKVNYGSLGKNTTMLMGEQLKHLGKFPMQEIAYPGSPQILLALLRGDVHMSILGIDPSLADIKAGRLKVLAVSSKQRVAAYPELPTIAETFPGFQAPTWGGILAPAGTPKAIVDKLGAEIAAIATSREGREAMLKLSFMSVGSTPEEFRREIDANMKTWSEVAAASNIQPD